MSKPPMSRRLYGPAKAHEFTLRFTFAKRASAVAESTPVTLTRFCRDRWPETIVTARLGTASAAARTSISSSLAAPSAGGACRRTRMASPRMPSMPDRFARGITRIVSSSASADCSDIRCDPFAPRTGFRTPEKRRSGVSSGGTPRGGPHPHALSLACATFFVNATAGPPTRGLCALGCSGVLHTVRSANRSHRIIATRTCSSRHTKQTRFRVFLSDNCKHAQSGRQLRCRCGEAVWRCPRVDPTAREGGGDPRAGSPPHLWSRGRARVTRPAAATQPLAARTGHRNPDSRQRQRNCRKDQGGPL